MFRLKCAWDQTWVFQLTGLLFGGIEQVVTSTTPKAKAWKRIVVSLVGLLAVAASIVLFLARTDSSRETFCEWAVIPLLFGGGIWFVIIGVRGQVSDVDDTVNRFFF